MKKTILSLACIGALCSTAALSMTPPLSLSLKLDQSLYNDNYVIDADACEYFANTCNDQLPGVLHDHESRHFERGWFNWKPNWHTMPNHYKVVAYHLSVRHPNGDSDIVACGSDRPIPPDAKHVSLKVFKFFGRLHCSIIG